jgi:hypothetical protein
LAKTRGAAFDRAFVREAQRINRDELRAFRNEAGRTADPDIHGFVGRFLEVEAKHEAAANALGDHVVASKVRVIEPPQTGDTMAVVPPASGSSMPMIVPPPNAGK